MSEAKGLAASGALEQVLAFYREAQVFCEARVPWNQGRSSTGA